MNAGDSTCAVMSRPHRFPHRMPAEERVLAIAIEIFRELRLFGLEIADNADNDRVSLGDLEHPEVVFDPWARLDFDRADGSKRRRQRAIAAGSAATGGLDVLGPV